MSIPETVLIFAGCPLGIIAVITLCVLGPSELRAPSRYRPGRPWNHEPAWFIPHPSVHEPAPGAHGALSAGHAPAPIEAAAHVPSAAGGASGEW